MVGQSRSLTATTQKGLPWATANDWKQLVVRFCLLLAQVHVACRTLGIIERPQTAAWRRGVAGIWRLEETQLRKAQGAVTVGFDQCTRGGAARKPAQLLLINAPGVQVRRCNMPSMCRCKHPSGSLQVLPGKRASGKVRARALRGSRR